MELHMELEFTYALAQQLYSSAEIIDFDWAWTVLGYSRKDNAKRMLVSYFEQNFDYFVQLPEESPEALPHDIFLTSEGKSKPGRPVEKIYLTVECFKEMGMLAKSDQGKQIRKYFLQCEALSKKSTITIPQLQEKVNSLQQSFELLAAQVQKLLPDNSNEIPPGWDAEVWASLPPQDKRHFKYIYRRRGFIPDTSSHEDVLAQDLSNIKQLHSSEVDAINQSVPETEKIRFKKLLNEAF
jgi:hypothetical protein